MGRADVESKEMMGTLNDLGSFLLRFLSFLSLL